MHLKTSFSTNSFVQSKSESISETQTSTNRMKILRSRLKEARMKNGSSSKESTYNYMSLPDETKVLLT